MPGELEAVGKSENLPREAELGQRVPAARSRWRRAAVIVLILGGGLMAFYGYLAYLAEKRLNEAIAETEALDPNWRLPDLQTEFAAVPDEENSVLCIRAVQALLPNAWSTPLDKVFDGPLEPQHQLTPKQHQTLREELAKLEPALKEARKLANMPRGRNDTPVDAAWITTGMNAVMVPREMTNLLGFDLLLACHERDGDGALTSCLAMLNTSRSLVDQPLLISMLVQVACRAVALGRLERILAQTEPSIKGLELMQRELEKEAAEPQFFQAVRGERGWSDAILIAAGSGDANAVLTATVPVTGSPQVDKYLGPLIGGSIRSQRAAMLKFGNRVFELAKLPDPERIRGLEQLAKSKEGRSAFVKLTAPAYVTIAKADRRSQSQLRAAIVALAAERCRLENKRWPDKPDHLVPRYLNAVPTDPIDGAPLRYRRRADGVVIYSLGSDGKDDGGEFDGSQLMPGTDIGFRLWDVTRRRQPAPVLSDPPADDPP